MLGLVEGEVQRSVDLKLATEPSEARLAVKDGNTAVLLSMEGAHGLGNGDDWGQLVVPKT